MEITTYITNMIFYTYYEQFIVEYNSNSLTEAEKTLQCRLYKVFKCFYVHYDSMNESPNDVNLASLR